MDAAAPRSPDAVAPYTDGAPEGVSCPCAASDPLGRATPEEAATAEAASACGARVRAAQAPPRFALARLGYLECAMLGAMAGSFSRWGSVVFRPFGRPSVYAPPRVSGLWADCATCEVLSLLASWLGFVPAIQIAKFRRLDTAVDAALLAGVRFWWIVAGRRRGGHRYERKVLCWHTSLALAELAYAIAETGPLGLAIAALDVRFTEGELADYVAKWLDHGLRKDRLLHLRQQRHAELMERVGEAARVFARIDSALYERVTHWGSPRWCEVRPWRTALLSVVSWTRMCGPPAAKVVSVVLGLPPEETLRSLQMRLRDASARGGARSDIWMETSMQM
jgi:hypothetical protein